MDDEVNVEWTLSVGLAGCKKQGSIAFAREEWESMDEEEREEVMKETVFQEIEWGYDVTD